MTADLWTGRTSRQTGRKGPWEAQEPTSWNLETQTQSYYYGKMKIQTYDEETQIERGANLCAGCVDCALWSGDTGCCSEDYCWGELLDLPPGWLCVQLQGRALYSSMNCKIQTDISVGIVSDTVCLRTVSIPHVHYLSAKTSPSPSPSHMSVSLCLCCYVSF